MASVSTISNLAIVTITNVANNFAKSKGSSQLDEDYEAEAISPMGISKLVSKAT